MIVVDRSGLLSLVGSRLAWDAWEALIVTSGYEIDRPKGSAHPCYADIVYPITYGYVRNTLGTDGEEIDLFVGDTDVGLVAAILATDYRRGDREIKLIYDCSPSEIYLINGFINFNRKLMEGDLVMRYPMKRIWDLSEDSARR